MLNKIQVNFDRDGVCSEILMDAEATIDHHGNLVVTARDGVWRKTFSKGSWVTFEVTKK